MTQTPLKTNFLKQHGKALFIFALLASISSIVAFAKPPSPVPQPSGAPPIPPQTNTVTQPNQSSDGKVVMSSQLSQSKLVQGSNSELVLDISIQPPEQKEKVTTRIPVDMVVILDRSSSMNGEQKFPLAIKAIKSLSERLNSDDRISLITFSHDGKVQLPLTHANQNGRQKLEHILNRLSPGGSTNMGKGLQLAHEQLKKPLPGHSSRVILLSDGQANSGIHDPEGLRNLVKNLSNNDVVVSTIGMGLGFNENVMSMLADHGMGSFNYLEHLAGLDGLFEKDLNDARVQYTSYSQLNFKLPQGLKLIDAAGYPIEHNPSSGITSLPLGQLLYGRKKSLMVTFSVPTDKLGVIEVGNFHLSYNSPEGQNNVLKSEHALAVEVVEAQRQQEVYASVKQDVYKKSWISNNLGRLRHSLSQSLRSGNRSEANQKIAEYEQQLAQVQAEAGFEIKNEELEEELVQLKEEVQDSFSGDYAEQKLKQNRYAKKNLGASRSSQRR